jgi:hypothetical protein
MSKLPDSRMLSQLSIPGTHDTMTYGAVGYIVPHVQTQTMSLMDQLNAGIRYLDIRVGPVDPGNPSDPNNEVDLELVHGPVPLQMGFNDDVVKTCEDFLSAHPSETIVMSIGNEGNAPDIDYIVRSHVNGADKNFWYSKTFVPTLGDARGKIVLFDEWANNLGINPTGPNFSKSDVYSFKGNIDVSSVISQKDEVLKDRLEKVQGTPNTISSPWFRTFTSCSVYTGDPNNGDPGNAFYQTVFGAISPVTVAEGPYYIIPGVNQFLSEQTFNARVGTVVMDFPHLDVINKVIGANDVNEAPTDIALSNATTPEQRPAGTFVGEFTTTDPNPSDIHFYELVPDYGDNAAFHVSGNGILITNQSFELATKGSYSIKVRSTDDGGLYVEKVFTIAIAHVDLAPTGITLSGNSVPENLAPLLGAIGTFKTTDPDNADTFTYSLFRGLLDDDQFVIDPAGVLRNNASFDFEAKSSYKIVVRSTDSGGLYFDEFFTINVTNVNEAPIAHDMTVKTTQNTPITFTVDATDPDGDALRVDNSFASVEGTVALVPGQPLQLTYTPPASSIGSFSFGYQVVDPSNASSNWATVTAIVTGPPAAISAVSGDGQSVQVGTQYFSQPLVVRVTDRAGNPLAGVGVTFTSPSEQDGVFVLGFGTMLTDTTTTDANGLVSVRFRPGARLSTYTVTAAVDGMPELSTGFTLTNVGPPRCHRRRFRRRAVGPGHDVLQPGACGPGRRQRRQPGAGSRRDLYVAGH